jgi:hypothetical protein
VNVRFAGLLIAVGIAFVVVLLPLGFSEIGLVGAPVVGLLGWWLAPAAAGGSWRLAAACGLGMGTLAAPLGAVAVAYLSLITALAGANSVGGALSDPTYALVIAVIGLPYSALVLPITLPAGVVWGVAVRAFLGRIVRERPVDASSLGVAHVAIILVVVAIGAALVPGVG